MSEKVGYLGPQGSYSEIAARRFGSDCVPFANFYKLVKALLCGEVACAALPIGNSLNGGVTQNIDILQQTEGIFAYAETSVKIDHRLVTLKGADLKKIKRVYSHGQALAQCARYLSENLPDAELIETPSTSACYGFIKSEEDAGIAGAGARREGFCYGEECISDEKNNYTQFLLVKKGGEELVSRSDKIYFSATCRHEAGALYNLLGVLSARGINMTKIESRPIKESVGEFRFFIEIEADCSTEKARTVLKEIKEKSLSFKLLGCY